VTNPFGPAINLNYMPKRGQSKPGEGEFTHLIDSDLERRRQRRTKKLAVRSEKGEKGTWEEGLGEAGKEFIEQAKRERKARIAALYSDLRIAYDSGSITDTNIRDYLESFPSDSEYQAFEEVAEAIEQKKIDKEIKKIKTATKVRLRRLDRAKLEKRDGVSQERTKILREAVGERLSSKEGPLRVPETRGDIFSMEEWREAILLEYDDKKITDKDLERFFENYSEEAKAAHQKLAEEERIKVSKESFSENKLSQEEVEEMLMRGLGFREEFIKDIPTQEGKTIFEEMLDEQIDTFKQILRDTISREDREKKIAEFGGDKEKAERELVAEAAKKFLAVRELFTHGVLGYDKEKGQMVLGRYSDLDGKCAIALFGKAGIDISKVGYLTPGEKKQGQITVDSSNMAGLVQESEETVDPKTGERKVEITTVFDHHGPPSDRDTSATKTVYKVFTELGLLKFKDEKEEENYDKVVRWVTRSDNFNFPGIGKYFDTSDRRMIGFLKFSNLDRLLKFAASGKELTDILSEQELKQFEINFKDRKTGKFIDRAKERRTMVDETKKKVRELASRGFSVSAKDGKKFLIDTTGEAGMEFQWAAADLGYDGIIRYNQETHGFFVALNQGEIDPKIFKDLPQGKLIRKSMFLQPMGQEKLRIGLGDLINRLSPGFEPGDRTELKRFLEREPWRIRSIVSRAPEGWWWTNTPSGKKVIVRGLPEGFKSGEEAYLLLEEPRNVREDERRKYGGNFYIGHWESDEIVLPKKPEAKKAPAKVQAGPQRSEIRKPEVKKEPLARVEIKKPAAPEVKAAAKPEIKPAAPKIEKARTPEERRKIEAEIALGKEKLREQVFEKIMQTLKDSSVWGKRSEEERKSVANNAADLQAKSFEQEKRKKYGI